MESETFSKGRFAVAVGLGLLGACFIWIAVPLNNYLLPNNLVSDSYMPEIAVALLGLVIIGVNPLLSLVRETWRLTRRQMALILGIWLMACVVPGGGLLGVLPYAVARNTQAANNNPVLAEAHKKMALPPALFPDRLEMGEETPVSDGLQGRHEPGTPLPWRQWLKPLAAWSPLILGCWLMMIGMGMIVYPQWRERERLSFPLLTMYEALIESPDPGRRLPPVLRDRLFWAGALLVLILHSFNGMYMFTNGGFPAFPLDWNLWPLFQDGVWRNAPWTLRGGHIFFTLVGIVYFMPNRISLSIWSGIITFSLYMIFKFTYFPSTVGGELDFKTGAWFAFALAILWLGRAHWAEVGRAMLSKSDDGTVARDRAAGRLFVAGLAVMFGWFLWVGLSLGASLGYVIFGTLLALLVSRVVCEAGLPLLNFSPMLPARFISMFPTSWWSAASIYIGGYVGIVFNYGARICAAVMCCFVMGLDRERKPEEQPRIAYLLLLVLVAGLVIAGAVHLTMAYGHEVALDGKSMIGKFGDRADSAVAMVQKFQGGASFLPPTVQRWPNFLGGVILSTGLLVCCLMFPKWPIHPIALLFVGSFIGDAIWPSIFFGWLIKTLVTTYGGARGYRAARPLFLGLVLGEVFAVIVWAIVPVVYVLTGGDPTDVGRASILLDM